MCATLKSKKARYAKDQNHENDDLSETKFMSELDIEVKGKTIIKVRKPTQNNGKTEDDKGKIRVYEFVYQQGDDAKSNQGSILIRVYDCGGHNEYTLINTRYII